MNERQLIFLLGAILGGIAGGCGGFALGMTYIMDDEQRNDLLRFEGWLDGYKDCLNQKHHEKA